MNHKYNFQTCLLGIMLILVSCSVPQGLSTTLGATSDVEHTLEPATPAISSQPTSTATSVLEATLLPTLGVEAAYQELTNLIQEDPNCASPCWLGIVPGRTNFHDVENIFSQFSAIALIELSARWAYMKVIYPTYYFTTLVHPTTSGQIDYIVVETSPDLEANAQGLYTDPVFRKAWQNYYLPELFSKHGAPEEVYLDTTLTAADPASSYPFVLWVIYPKEGFLVRYEGYNLKSGEDITVCPLQSKIKIILWNPETSTYEEFLENDMAMGTSLGPQPIESVTDFSTDAFYEMFKTAHFDTCFDTPISSWPH